MDFMRLLKSFEEFLYEIASWIVFYPITMWRTLRHPSAMMRYADIELLDNEADQYIDTLSPPLFLLVTLVIAHSLELSLLPKETSVVLPSFLASADANLVIFREISYSLFPLFMASKLLRKSRTSLDRRTLRPPFYSQCYVAAPFALGINIATILVRMGGDVLIPTGLAVFLLVLVWYVTIQTRWFRADLGVSTTKAAFMVLITVCEALVAVILVGAIVVTGIPGGSSWASSLKALRALRPYPTYSRAVQAPL
ncbi:permease [Rhizobium tubonense]|uniref:Permease n=1 Tax=Rhizobium tubonense TaxID=484088 RepID=A0A2W4F953_9HYPH|nr:permease [Rhizobium tubonense]PZM17190.1 permease [Rhizobium tubonense]